VARGKIPQHGAELIAGACLKGLLDATFELVEGQAALTGDVLEFADDPLALAVGHAKVPRGGDQVRLLCPAPAPTGEPIVVPTVMVVKRPTHLRLPSLWRGS
jgi:hypothetical protein